jgi:hypothetical protein
MKDYEQNYEEYWKELIEPDGKLDMDALKRELYDYWVAIENVGEVYCHITGNRFSKPNTLASVMIDEADAHYERIFNAQANSQAVGNGLCTINWKMGGQP